MVSGRNSEAQKHILGDDEFTCSISFHVLLLLGRIDMLILPKLRQGRKLEGCNNDFTVHTMCKQEEQHQRNVFEVVFCFCTTGLEEDNCISKKIWHKSQVLGSWRSGSGSMSDFESNLPPQTESGEGRRKEITPAGETQYGSLTT